MRLPSGVVATVRSTLGIIAMVLGATGWGMMGCSLAADHVLPAPLENLVTSNGSADDHMMAATLYQQEAQRLQAEAARYEQEAAAIEPLQDPKGFRRNGLLAASQRNRTQAAEMQQFYAAHYTKAQTLTGKQQLQ